MEYLGVFTAAAAGFGVGAIWYALLSGHWMEATGLSKDYVGGSASIFSYIAALIAYLLVAGMMRHMFVLSNIGTFDKGLVAGIGIGLFIVSPWIMMSNTFAGRPIKLSLIDGGSATLGCAVIGAVLSFL